MLSDKVKSFSPNVDKALEDYKDSLLWNSLLSVTGTTWEDIKTVILGIIQQESGGNPFALGDSGNSLGLMQLNYGAGLPQELGFTGAKEDLYIVDVNIEYGVKNLLKKFSKYLDLNKAILAYNAGSYKEPPVNPAYLQSVLLFIGFPSDYFSKKKHSVTWF